MNQRILAASVLAGGLLMAGTALAQANYESFTLGAGFLLGLAKLTIQTFYGKNKISDPSWLAAIGDFNFLYATGVLMLLSVIIMITVSLLTPPPSEEQTRGLTYGSIHHLAGDEIKDSWDPFNKVLAGLILLLVGGLYLYFSFWLS